ncbi:MAG: hypothetical protein J6J30_02930 [Clostridia bacterium]|nr:hypothetical protein [Clostridia bacterium]
MARSTMGIIKGVTAGLAVGMAAGYVGSAMKNNKRKTKKISSRAVKTVNEIMDTLMKG